KRVERPECAEHLERTKHERNPLGGQRRIRVAHVKMQMRPTEDAARGADPRQLLSATNAVADFDPNASRLQVLVERETPIAKVDRKIISGLVVDRYGSRRLLEAIDRARDDSVRHRQNVRSVSVGVPGDRSVVVIRPPVMTELDPVDRETGRNSCLPIDLKECPSVSARARRVVQRCPWSATNWRAEDHRAATNSKRSFYGGRPVSV